MHQSGNIASYSRGFALSVILTLGAYFAVADHWLNGWAITIFIAVLAVLQLSVQLFFFLHLGKETRPRLNLLLFSFMALMVLTIVIGSLWIMHNLNYHTTQPHDTDKYLLQEEGRH